MIVPPRSENLGDLGRTEVAEEPVDEPTPAFQHAEAIPTGDVRGSYDRADDRIQAGTVATTRQDPDLLWHRVLLGSWFPAARLCSHAEIVGGSARHNGQE